MADVLVVNAGSTSLKLDLVDEADASTRLGSLADVPDGVAAVGHRVVHGGARFREPVLIDGEVKRAIAELAVLAPLHNRPALAAINRVERDLPDVPQLAVFDTAFHAGIAEETAVYAVPRRWREEWGVRRYGFHGLSVQWSSERVPVPRLVVCHLGGGCSVTAVADGRSVATTMGFSPLEGVPMATRSGSIDPGALLYLLRERKLTLEELDHALEHESGLLALGGSTDPRELEGTLALKHYVLRIAEAVAAMAASLGGLDALVFTAGVGENSAPVRSAVCARLGLLGVELDGDANAGARPDTVVSTPSSTVAVHVVRAREELVIARAVRGLGFAA